jgi:hypothetical protein
VPKPGLLQELGLVKKLGLVQEHQVVAVDEVEQPIDRLRVVGELDARWKATRPGNGIERAGGSAVGALPQRVVFALKNVCKFGAEAYRTRPRLIRGRW